MKKIKVLSIIALSAIIVASCGEKKAETASSTKITKAEIDSVSYAIGVSLGSMVKQGNFGELNYSEINKAMQDVLKGKDLKIAETAASGVIQRFMTKRQEVVATENLEKGKAFLEGNKTKDSVVTTASGLQYKIINAGSEMKPKAEDTVEVNYRGTLIDGTEFDTSYGKTPARFALNGVIKGWTEGVQMIGEGGKIRMYIPAELAYGAQQAGPTIGPNSTLIFDVELLKITPAKAVAAEPAKVAPVKK